jgi:hypothetical protein
MNIYVRPDGTAQCVYNEDINLSALGELDIKRASHVEPIADQPGKWGADLAPVNGPFLGPFDTRAEALAAEIAWLDNELTLRPVHVTR